MSNAYGFDFLKNEHLDEDALGAGPSGPSSSAELTPGSPQHASAEQILQAQNKPDLEKQSDILDFLKSHRASGCLAPNVIYRSTGIDLEVDTPVAEMLQKNPKIRVEWVPDPENPALTVATYAYQAKYSNVRDRTTLLAQINRMVNGVRTKDLDDAYPNVLEDVGALITAGDILAIVNTEDKDKILFPRGEAFLVELDGIVSLPKTSEPSVTNGGNDAKTATSNGGSHPPDNGNHAENGDGSDDKAMPPPTPQPKEVFLVETDVDPLKQIRRGEAVQVGGQWFRVSSAVKAGAPLSEQPARAQAPLSVVSLEDLSKRNEQDGYIRPLSSKLIPLDASLTTSGQNNLVAAKQAREHLSKLAHGSSRNSTMTGKLIGSHAHEQNPSTLAAAFAGSAMSSMRKRPSSKVSAATNNNGSNPTQQSAQQAKRASKEALEKAASDPNLSLYSHARRHGCTRDIREMYLATRNVVPKSDDDFHQLLVEEGLLEPGEQMRRKRLTKSSNVDNDGKPKKRRYYERKNQRLTNTHLLGTDIGAALARAAEQQKQGKTVGDGGM